MGFFYDQSAADARNTKRGPREIPIHLMKDQACRACSLNEVDKRRHTPKFKPAGGDKPIVYIVSSYPTADEDASGQHLDDAIFDVVRKCIPRDIPKSLIRYGHAVRCRPAKDARPDAREITCCSGLLETDIAATRPKVVIGLGELPLRWALGEGAGDSKYRGRIWPIKAGDHVCYYYQVQDPGFVHEKQGDRRYETEITRALKFDLKRIFDTIDNLPDVPRSYVPEEQRALGIETITGHEELHYDHLCAFLDEAATCDLVGIDIETTSLRPYEKHSIIATCSISTDKRTLAFPVDHPRGWPEALRRSVRLKLYEFLVTSKRKTAHHLGFELEWFCYLLDPSLGRSTEWADSYAAAHTLDERPGVLSLGAMTQIRFGFNVKKMSNIDVTRLLEYELEDVLHYNALDSKWGRELTVDLEDEINLDRALIEEYQRKVRLCPTLVLSQIKGLCVDEDYARKWSEILGKEIDSARLLISKAVEVRKFEKEFGRTFSPTSDDDVLLLVRDIMKREEGRRGETGYSCDEATLSAIPEEAGLAPPQILILRGAAKLKSTYVDPVINKDPTKGEVLVFSDGRMHPSYNSMIAETGRLSSNGPNAQNFPKRKRVEIRGVVVCPDGCYFVAFDYGQIEARVIAMMSEDRALVDALWTDFDIHGHWATRFVKVYPEIKDWIVSTFKVDWDEKGLKTLRQEAKNKWVFPQFFGASPRSCAGTLHLPLDVAEKLAKEFWDQFQGVRRWQKRMVTSYERNLYVETLGGRRRRGALSINQIFNTPVQGSAADLVTEAQNRLSEYAQINEGWQFSAPLQVHDDLSFYLPRATMVEDADFIATEMCRITHNYINVPLLVEVSISKRHWHDMKEIGTWRSDELGFHSKS